MWSIAKAASPLPIAKWRTILRRYQTERNGEPWPPIFIAANKADNAERRQNAVEFYEFGLGEVYPISSLHGLGTGDLLDAVVASFEPIEEEEEDESIKIAIVGRPNVGKSSLLNAILGKSAPLSARCRARRAMRSIRR